MPANLRDYVQHKQGCESRKCSACGFAAPDDRESWDCRGAVKIKKNQCSCGLDALLSSSSAERTEGWQPIETAPKDGSYMITIVGRYLDCVPAIGWFDVEGKAWRTVLKEEFDEEEWKEHCAESEYEPSHWMPLPAHPHANKRNLL